MEALCARKCEEISARLAYHFEKGLDCLKTAQYLLLVARIEARKFAHNGATPDLDPLWTILDLTPASRGSTWYPKLEYASLTTIK
jgi:predicted dithiol-disulfide oxidoreductase (DUF899 family)